MHATPLLANKPVRIIVPFAPGGTTDILARALAVTSSWFGPCEIKDKLVVKTSGAKID